ncbi:hypothetical protein [Paracoccus yeei]|uniref:Uncharacterized protein n=1 Tax=Paracoccus yeei TaxID=147645 RepID=A0A5P2QPT1_9RHOB|nr:hypothetical protein [Paracoccus yeei]QEU07419.1 hypothetical protein FOB51_04960 [Paracoccus yeei]
MNTSATPTNDQRASAQNMFPYVKLVPAGISADGRQLRITAVITPDAFKGHPIPDGGLLSLRRLTETILARLQRDSWEIGISFRDLTSSIQNTECIPPISQIADAWSVRATAADLKKAFGGSSQAAKNRLQNLVDEWGAALTRGADKVDDKTWNDMAHLLETSLDGSRLKPDLTRNLGYRSPSFGANGQLNDVTAAKPDQSGTVVSLLAVPESDLAALIDRQRAAQLWTQLTGATSSGQVPDPATVEPSLEDREIRDLPDANKADALAQLKKAEQKNPAIETELASARQKLVKAQKEIQHFKQFLAISSRRNAACNLFEAEIKRQQSLSSGTPQSTPATPLPERGATMQDLMAASDAYSYETWEQRTDQEDFFDSAPLSNMARAYFAIQSNPVLARLFGLVVDLVLPLDGTLASRAQAQPLTLLVACDLRSAYLDPAADSRALPWTLCRLRAPSGGADSGEFWPVDSSEVVPKSGELKLIQNGRMTMYIGEGANRQPRFDVTSLDFRSGAELWSRHRSIDDAAIADPTFSSLGMTLLDRCALHGAARKLASAATKCEGAAGVGACIQHDANACRHLLLDASDLCIGVRLDVGVPDPSQSGNSNAQQPATLWRPLMSRITTYGSPTIEDSLNLLLGTPQGARRMELESPSICQGARLLPFGKTATQPQDFQAEAVVTESLSLWDGNPMGVLCGLVPDSDAPGDVLSRGRVLALPDPNAAPMWRLPRLRCGWAYRFTARNVYAGGISIPFAKVDETRDGDCVFPSAPRAGEDYRPYRRFLRQERLAAPVAVMPGRHALARQGQQGELGHENVEAMIVRTARLLPQETATDLTSRERPTRAQRIIVVPAVSQDMAARHGVLDRSNAAAPLGAFSRMVMNRNASGFQTALTRTTEGPDLQSYLVDRSLSGRIIPQSGPGLHVHEPCLSRHDRDRASRYYPDPLAEHLIITARDALTGTRLRGYIQLPLLPSGSTYPDLLPVAITLEKLTAPRTKAVQSIDDLLPQGIPSRPSRYNPDAQGDIFRGNTNETAWDLRFALAPGEDCNLQMWFLPSAKTLASKMALIESLATIPQRDSCAATPINTDCLQQWLSGHAAGGTFAKDGFVGPEGVICPGPKVLMDIARCVYQHMLQQPVPTIAAVSQMRLTHAVNRPLAAPELVGPFTGLGDRHSFVAHRPASLQQNDLTADRFAIADGKPPQAQIAQGSSNFMLSGLINLDICACGAFEIEAELAMPPGGALDDRKMRRSLLKRRAGTWPYHVDAQGRPQMRQPRDVFGFDVEPDTGFVSFPQNRQMVLRVDDLTYAFPTGQKPVLSPGPISFEIAPFFADPPEGSEPNDQAVIKTSGWIPNPTGGDPIKVIVCGRTTVRLLLPDTKAHKMKLTTRAISRTARLFDSINFIDRIGEFRAARSLAPDLQSVSSAADRAIKIIVPPSERPSQCAALTPHPAFLLTLNRTATEHREERVAMVRLRLERSWFSSGEDEKIGLAIWPPDLFDQTDLVDNRIFLRDRMDVGDAISFADFTDVDLGPGGAYITRKGADPIRSSDRDRRLFLVERDFPDLTRHPDNRLDPTHPTYRAREQMPIATASAAADQSQASSTLQVGLLLLEPRFDMEEEIWYADLRIRPELATNPFVRLGLVRYQPHAPERLRLSLPTTQWTQLLPRREIVLTHQNGFVRVEMRSQQMAQDARPDVSQATPPAKYDRPLLRIRLLEEKVQNQRLVSRQELSIQRDHDQVPSGPIYVSAMTFDGAPAWEFKFVAPQQKPGLRHSLYIEEIEMRQPASYDKEPVEPQSDDIWIPSGPKSAMHIPLGDILGGAK